MCYAICNVEDKGENLHFHMHLYVCMYVDKLIPCVVDIHLCKGAKIKKSCL